jgi:outer membrane protein OmpA-like peptidoglycan-associated protein
MNFAILRTLLFFTALVTFSCASSQPLPKSGTNNKKARQFLQKSYLQMKAGQYVMALGTIEKALKKDEKYIDALMLKGDLHTLLKEFDEAVKTYDKIFTIEPGYVKAYYNKGNAQLQAQNYKAARETLEKFKTYPYSKKLQKQVDGLLAICDFAENSIANPVPFSPKNLGPAINTKDNEYFPGLTADEQKLYFTRLLNGFNEDFYVSYKVDSTWQNARNLGRPVNTPDNEGFVSISTDGQYIFFTACNRPDSKGSCDLYFSKLEGDIWRNPINMQAPVNTVAWESQPSLSFDGKNIYFSSHRPGGYGGSDIWMTTFENNRFTEPVNLGPNINTEYDENTPFIHPDNRTLYFSSSGWPGMGMADIFYSKKDEKGNWKKPVNLGYPINTPASEIGFIVNRKGDWAYFASDMPGGYGGLDIYGFELYEEARPELSSYAKGEVYDAETKQKLEANIELIDLATGEILMTSRTNKKTGEFLMVLQPNSNYMLNVNKEGYLFHSENFAMEEYSADKPFLISVPLSKFKEGEKVILKNVFFDTDKFNLKNESKAELNKLIALLKEQASLKIEIGGHTDNTGNKKANQTLSENRAKAVYQYLIDNGIASDRLSYKGYGDTKPIADNATEEGRSQNRRTEFTIVGI